MPPTKSAPTTPSRQPHVAAHRPPEAQGDYAWPMLLALITGFALSQAFRTITAIIATGLRTEFGLTSQALGMFAGTFAFSFGVMQLFMGICIDLYGIRRSMLSAFPLAIAGALLSALAPNYEAVLAGQMLIGVGCAPAFVVCTVFIARHFPAQRFAVLSGMALGLGGLGMLFTGTPLAWLVQHSSWRAGFMVLAGMSALAWLMIFWKVREPQHTVANAPKESVSSAVGGFMALFTLPHTWGIVLLGLVTYASFLTLRGLWLGPMLIERHGYSLVASGNVATVVSLVSLLGPAFFGRLDPGPLRRRTWLIGYTLLMAGIFAVMGLVRHVWSDMACLITAALLCGYMVLQYADVRSAYPESMTGRAMAVFTMALFIGVALMQWLTGLVASVAQAQGLEPYGAVMFAIAALLGTGALGFKLLPAPPVK